MKARWAALGCGLSLALGYLIGASGAGRESRGDIASLSSFARAASIQTPPANSGWAPTLAPWLLVGAAAACGYLVVRRRRGREIIAGAPPDGALNRRLRRSPGRVMAAQHLVDAARVRVELPFGARELHLTREERIERAAAASRAAGVTLGVVCLFPRESALDETAARDRARRLAELAAKFEEDLRDDNCFVAAEANVVAVFFALLKEPASLAERALRLVAMAARHNPALAFEAPGVAVYPMHGYKAAELIEGARANRLGRKQRA